jgi:tetratricopeptide (TPR) repeat protein
VRTQDHFWVLGVPETATADVVDRAYEALARSFHADRYRLSPEEDRKAAEEIFARLAEAHQTLRDAGSRRAYIAKQSRAAEKAEAAAEAAAEAQAQAAATAAEEAAETAAEAAAYAAAPGTPPPAPGPTTPPAERTPAVTIDEAIAVTMTPAPPPTTAPNATARLLYEAGLDHLRARRHHEAVEALRQAARLVPNEADFRAALGWALFRQAPADARAGRAAVAELRRALQLDERHREAAQRLAEIYAQTGQPELAVRELERLLEIDPGDAEVAEELRRLRAR